MNTPQTIILVALLLFCGYQFGRLVANDTLERVLIFVGLLVVFWMLLVCDFWGFNAKRQKREEEKPSEEIQKSQSSEEEKSRKPSDLSTNALDWREGSTADFLGARKGVLGKMAAVVFHALSYRDGTLAGGDTFVFRLSAYPRSAGVGSTNCLLDLNGDTLTGLGIVLDAV